MNKRGQELPLTTVIIAILVVLVLVLVIVIFLGGMRGVSEKIRGTWGQGIAGTDINLALENCQNYCQQAKMFPQNLLKSSAFCTVTFNLDTKGMGEADKDDERNYIKYHCYGNTLNVPCKVDSVTLDEEYCTATSTEQESG